MRRAAAALTGLAGGLAALAAPSSRASEAGWDLLRRGGHVALVRHAHAPGGGDPASFRIDDCGTQRNLDGMGRRQAVRIGDLFRRRGVRVARILTSQWCRCRETARLIATELKDVQVQDFPVLNSFFGNRSTEPRQTAGLRRFIRGLRGGAAGGPKGGIVVLVTHQVNIAALTGVYTRSGEIVVVRAGPDADFRAAARIGTAR